MLVARGRAGEWRIDPARIGVMGFSAGGHLASTLATHAKPGDRPAFAALVYPVITFTGPATHTGSRANLLGKDPAPALLALYSSEQQVSEQTPACFLVHAADDPVKVANSELFVAALEAKGVAHEFMRLQTGGHGFGLGVKGGEPAAWPQRFLAWLQARKTLPP
jgi:acetyl esterase/lipase